MLLVFVDRRGSHVEYWISPTPHHSLNFCHPTKCVQYKKIIIFKTIALAGSTRFVHGPIPCGRGAYFNHDRKRVGQGGVDVFGI